jgi:hypothetical protein
MGVTTTAGATVLTPHDDHPIHQTPAPMAHVVSGDPNHYDRYFFNGLARDGSFAFGAAMGHYPNRDVVDGAFSIVRGDAQRSVFASGRLPADRRSEVGPLRVEVVEPLRTLRVVVAPNDHGLEADLVFRARTGAVEEPRTTVAPGGRLTMDYTRLTQWGTWEGEVVVEGEPVAVDPAATVATRDRSWGVRPVGAPTPTNVVRSLPQLFWLWAPLHFDDVCTHLAVFEHADGQRWLESALVVPVLAGAGAPTWGVDLGVEELSGLEHELRWRPGTREIEGARLGLSRRDGDRFAIELEPVLTFRMRGLGYLHPHWGHGSAHGSLEVGGEVLDLDALDPTDRANVHVQTVCRATMGERTGIGVLEQLAIGEHQPSGLRGILDGYAP